MKKYIILLSIISFAFFSCATKQAVQNHVEEEIANTLQEEVQNISQVDKIEYLDSELKSDKEVSLVENNENLIENEENVSPSEVDPIQTVDQVIEETSDTEVPLQSETILDDVLEEIIEPEVITLEPEEETVKEPEAVVEPVIDDAIEIMEKEALEVTVTVSNESSDTIAAVENAETVEKIENVETAQKENTTGNTINSVEDVIDISDESDVSNQEEIEQKKPVENIIPSRSITLKKLEYLDITYPGNGWIYMGLTDGSKDLTYFGRKVGTENTKFSVQAKVEGKKILHFYKNDPLKGNFIDDYLEVIVLNEKGSNKTRIEAPEYKAPVLKKEKSQKKTTPAVEQETVVEQQPVIEEKKTETAEKETPVAKNIDTTQGKTEPKKNIAPVAKQTKVQEEVIDITDEVEAVDVEPINTDNLLKEIKNLIESKDYKNALDKLIIFSEHATNHRDEGLFLQGQVYEAKSDVQNIQLAIESYTTLTKNYPASKFWDDANKRVIYLKRFYLEGR